MCKRKSGSCHPNGVPALLGPSLNLNIRVIAEVFEAYDNPSQFG
jgi:hypothetical protein